jgi:putative nucleotidyltransferase with HDIG domain
MNWRPDLAATRALLGMRFDSVKPLSGAVTDTLALLADDGAHLQHLTDRLELDPVLSARLLGLANIAGSRLPDQQVIADVRTAVSVLGFARIRMLLATLVFRDAFAASIPDSLRDSFWEHCLNVGVAARVIAEHSGLNADMAYVAGLIHDIGNPWLVMNYPELAGRYLRLLDESGQTVMEAEYLVFGTDHCAVGALMCEEWGLPGEIVLAVHGHHNPDYLPASPYVMVVHLAETVCHGLSLDTCSRGSVTHLSEQAMPILGMDWAAMPDLFGEIQARARFMRVMAGLVA